MLYINIILVSLLPLLNLAGVALVAHHQRRAAAALELVTDVLTIAQGQAARTYATGGEHLLAAQNHANASRLLLAHAQALAGTSSTLRTGMLDLEQRQSRIEDQMALVAGVEPSHG